MHGRRIEGVTLVREVTREVKVNEAVTVQVTDSGRATGLTLEDVLDHLDENGAGDDIRQGSTVLASVSVDEDTVDEADSDATEWEAESVAYADSDPETIHGSGLDADEVFRLASKRYRLTCERRGELAQQPCLYRSVLSHDRVILANVNGELARYAVRNNELTEK